MTTKETNPKDVIGSTKLPLHLFPTTAIASGSLALLDGAMKYGRSNYRVAGVRASIYYDASLRHLMKWFEGEDFDRESGLDHLGHALACIAILIDSKAANKLTDDRMVAGGFLERSDEYNSKTNEIKNKYDNPNVKHYTKADSD